MIVPTKPFCNWKRYGRRHNLYTWGLMELDKLFLGPKVLISFQEIEKELSITNN